MEVAQKMCKINGYYSMINIPVWMFLSSFEKMRIKLLEKNTFSTVLHFGRGVFGSDFGTVAFVLKNKRINRYKGTYYKLYERQGEVERIEEKERKFISKEGIYYKVQDSYNLLPGSQIAYWISDKIYDAFGLSPDYKLDFYTKSGMTTGDNEKFLKLWFEISDRNLYFSKQPESIIPTWYPHLKGGEFRKWYGDYDYIVRYDKDSIEQMKLCPGFRHDGKDFFFKRSVTWSKTTAGPLSARINSDNTTFNTAGCGLFTNCGKELYALAMLNSVVSKVIMSFLCPSLSYAPGDVAKLPIKVSGRDLDEVEEKADECVSLSKKDWDSFETSWDFKKHPLI
jgi:hypothetical protein